MIQHAAVLGPGAGSRRWRRSTPALWPMIRRHDDVVWRVRLGITVYAYLLLEFQSTVDRCMAVRVSATPVCCIRDLIRASPHQDRLPPVLLIVLYNGGLRWTAAADLSALIPPCAPGIATFGPNNAPLLDEGATANKRWLG